MTLNASSANDASIDAPTLKAWLHDDSEIALLDVREHGQYGESHIFQAAPVPYSRLEIDIVRLAPRRSVRVVVYDEGDGVAERAQTALQRIGYTTVYTLRGGIAHWVQAGFNVFAGVNVPSKTFGELAEIAFHTPRIGAAELASRLERGDDLVVLDGRPFPEYQKMSIPGAICCPNGELALHAQALAPDPATTIVVNCAGRTRSIIGAQTLINLGVPNPVLALENGTQGWYLQDLSLEHGATRRHAPQAPAETVAWARTRAQDLARRAGVPTVNADQAQRWLNEDGRSTYLCDVRTPEEFVAGTLAGAQHTPGGQLIQATDQYIAVRGARLILIDDDGVRAPVVGSWLTQMGWEVAVLENGVNTTWVPAHTKADQQIAANGATRPGGVQPVPVSADAGCATAASLPPVACGELAAAMQAGAHLIDLRPSSAYRAQHIESARWSIRPRLAQLALPQDAHVVLLTPEAELAMLAAQDLRTLGIERVSVNTGSPSSWRDAGLTLVSTPDNPPDSACIDFLFFVHDRHDGNKQAARQYLAWETNLIHQIDPQERATFEFTLSAHSHDTEAR